MSTLRGPAQLADLQGALCVPTYNFTNGVDELNLLLWQRSSNLSDFVFVLVAIFLSLSNEPTTPVPSRVASQWSERPSSYNGDHNSSEMAGAFLLVVGHVPHGRHLPTTCERHCYSEHTPRPGFWSHQFPASWQYKPLRSGTAQAPPIRLVCSALCQHVAQHISASCQHKPQDRPSTCTLFAVRGSEAYARHATDKHTGISPSNDHRRGLRLLREPIDQHTPLLSEPDPRLRDPLGLRAPCSRSSCRGSFLVIPLGKEQVVLVECLGFFVWRALAESTVLGGLVPHTESTALGGLEPLAESTVWGGLVPRTEHAALGGLPVTSTAFHEFCTHEPRTRIDGLSALPGRFVARVSASVATTEGCTGRGSISPAADTVVASVFAISIEGGTGSAKVLAAATPSAHPT